MAELRWAAATDPGEVRDQNEDNVHAGPTVFVVADGMGGHLAGEVASEIAVDRVRELVGGDELGTLPDLVRAVEDANTKIYAAAEADPTRAGMGTTVTALAVVSDPIDGEALALTNVGDSRAYVVRHGRLRQVTVDHNYVQELVAEGHITRDEARYHPRRNIVTRALGIDPIVRVDAWPLPIIRGDRFLLCSDGLVDEVVDEDIADVLVTVTDPQEACDRLVELAKERGGRDNITVIVVDVVEGDEPPEPTQEFDVVPTWSDDRASTAVDADAASQPGGSLAAAGATAAAAAGARAFEPPDIVPAEDDDADADDDEPSDADITAPLTIRTEVAEEEAARAAAEARASGLFDGADDSLPAPTGPPPPPTTAPAAETPKKRGRLGVFLTGVGFMTVIAVGAAIFIAWARDGYFVSFDADNDVVIYRGQPDGVLWFDPTVEAETAINRDDLDDRSVELVEDTLTFQTRRSAENFVNNRLVTTTTSVPESSSGS